jgi:Negative regulator of sigma F
MSGTESTAAPRPASPPIADVRARVLAAVEREPVVARATGARRRVALAIGAVVLLAAGSLAVAQPGLRGRPLAYVVALASSWMLVGVGATWASVTRGRSMLGRPAAWRLAVAVATPLALLVASWVAGAVWPPAYGDVARASHAVCFAMTIGLALGPLALFLVLRGATDPVSPHLTAASLAAAAGAWGALGIALHCGIAAPSHVILGHVLPVALLAAFAGLAAGRFVALRPARR